MYKYFVSYFYADKINYGIANQVITCSKKINTGKIIRQTQEYIQRINNLNKVIIVNFKLLEE